MKLSAAFAEFALPLFDMTEQMLALLKEDALPEARFKLIMQELKRDVDYSSGLVRNLLSWAGSQMNGRVCPPLLLK